MSYNIFPSSLSTDLSLYFLSSLLSRSSHSFLFLLQFVLSSPLFLIFLFFFTSSYHSPDSVSSSFFLSDSLPTILRYPPRSPLTSLLLNLSCFYLNLCLLLYFLLTSYTCVPFLLDLSFIEKSIHSLPSYFLFYFIKLLSLSSVLPFSIQ